MACLSARTAFRSHQHHTHTWVFRPNFPNFPSPLRFFPSSTNHSSSSTHLRRSFRGSPLNLSRSFLRCRAVSPGPPPSPPGGEPPQKGITTTITRVWDTVQIFFAVFIWMSLFFWASATDRSNKGGRGKGNRLKK